VEVALLLLGLAVGVLVCTAVSERVGVPSPFLLIVTGVVVSWVPWVPQVYLHEDVVLLGLLPPLLYAAAVKSSLVDIRANSRPILWLSVGLVVFTAAGVAVVVHWLLPGLSWALAFAIGAVVAPPDAIAATAIGRRIGLPRRVVTILEGESLFNDATALVSLRTALAVAGGHAVDVWGVSLEFLVAAVGGGVVGFVVYVVVAKARQLLTDPVIESAASLAVPFAAYLVAEEVGASGVIAVVVSGLLLGHQAPVLQTAQARIAERLNWSTIAYVLENVVFLLIGLQAWWIVDEALASGLGWPRLLLACGATLLTVMGLRMAWLLATRYLLMRPDPVTGTKTSVRHMFLIGWAGMRGVVTLAAAFLIPADTAYREVLLLVAFSVVAGTLFLQGMTLPWVARRLRVPPPDPRVDALARAGLLQQTTHAALEALDRMEVDDKHGVATQVRDRLEQRDLAAWERLATAEGEETPSEQYARVRLALIEVERRTVLEIRGEGSVPAEVVAEVLAALDVEESMLDRATDAEQEVRTEQLRHHAGESCADLRRHPPADPPDDPVCEECVRDGTPWVALRMCLACGHVGCCDSSRSRHATAHFHDTEHPVIQSAEPGERWRWCFVHRLTG